MTGSPARPAPLVADFDRAGLRSLRHQIEEWTRRNGLTDLALYRFVVAVNEITTNAVCHGGGRGRLTLRRTGDRLDCTVTDRGTGVPAGRRPELPGPDVPGGRGLWLARRGTDEFVLHSTGHGTTVRLAVHTGDA